MPSLSGNGVQRLGLNVLSSHQHSDRQRPEWTQANSRDPRAGVGQIGLCPAADGALRRAGIAAAPPRSIAWTMYRVVTRASGYPRMWEPGSPPSSWAMVESEQIGLCSPSLRPTNASCRRMQSRIRLVRSPLKRNRRVLIVGCSRPQTLTATGSGRAAAAGSPERAPSRRPATAPGCGPARPFRSPRPRPGCASSPPTDSGASSRSTRW